MEAIDESIKLNYPQISVVTVCFNAVDTIEKTILSVINQTYENIEYIIIDGASTDGTVDIIKKYENHLAKWISEPDDGIYDAMNKGIKLSTGEWILFRKSGDLFYDEEVLDKVFSGYEDKGEALITGDLRFVKGGRYFDCPPHILKFKIFNAMPMFHPSTFIRRKIHINNLYATKYKYCADYNMILSLLNQGYTYKYLPFIISVFDYNSGASTDNLLKVLREDVDIVSSYGANNSVIFRYRIRIMKQWIKSLLFMMPFISQHR